MSERFLAKAQVRKAASLVIYEKTKQGNTPEKAVSSLLLQFPALKHPDQQERVVKRAERTEKIETARREFIQKLMEHISLQQQ